MSAHNTILRLVNIIEPNLHFSFDYNSIDVFCSTHYYSFLFVFGNCCHNFHYTPINLHFFHFFLYAMVSKGFFFLSCILRDLGLVLKLFQLRILSYINNLITSINLRNKHQTFTFPCQLKLISCFQISLIVISLGISQLTFQPTFCLAALFSNRI